GREAARRDRPVRAAGPDRGRDAAGAGTPAMGDEHLPRPDRHHEPAAAGTGARHRRAPGSAQGLPDLTGLHLALRTALDRRDGAPSRRRMTAARNPVRLAAWHRATPTRTNLSSPLPTGSGSETS